MMNEDLKKKSKSNSKMGMCIYHGTGVHANECEIHMKENADVCGCRARHTALKPIELGRAEGKEGVRQLQHGRSLLRCAQ